MDASFCSRRYVQHDEINQTDSSRETCGNFDSIWYFLLTNSLKLVKINNLRNLAGSSALSETDKIDNKKRLKFITDFFI